MGKQARGLCQLQRGSVLDPTPLLGGRANVLARALGGVWPPLCKKKRLPLQSSPQYQAEERETPSQTRQTGGKQSEWTKWGQSQGTCPVLQPVAAPPSLVTPAPTPPQTEWQSSFSPPPARQPSAAQAAQSPRPAHPPGVAAFFCLSSARRQALEEQGFRGSFVTLDEPQHLESHAWPSTVIDRAQSLV